MTGRLICHQVRTRSKPAPPARGAGARRRRTRRCRSAARRARARADGAGLADGPLDQHVGAARPRPRARSRSTTWTKSIRPPARSCTLPQARISPSASRSTTFSRVRRPCSETSTSTSSTEARPAPPVPLVGAQQVGQPRQREPVGGVGRGDLPAAGQRQLFHCVGWLFQPVVLGDHGVHSAAAGRAIRELPRKWVGAPPQSFGRVMAGIRRACGSPAWPARRFQLGAKHVGLLLELDHTELGLGGACLACSSRVVTSRPSCSASSAPAGGPRR